MVERVRLREMTTGEQDVIDKLAGSRTAAARLVERARIVQMASQGLGTTAIARRVDTSRPCVLEWIKRFNASGVTGLVDLCRSGRPPSYTPEQTAEVIATALTDPQTLELPYGSWTLDRLETYLNGRGLAIKRSRIDELLITEGLRWRKHETWFGARVDPEFAEKRGRLRPSTPSRRRTA